MNLESIKALTTEIVESLRNINSSQSYYLDKIKPLPHTPDNKELTTESPKPSGYIEEIMYNLREVKKLLAESRENTYFLSQVITDVATEGAQASDGSDFYMKVNTTSYDGDNWIISGDEKQNK